MKYRNASEVLPEALLKEIQKYVSGETLYIPTKEERVGWGESSGAKAFYTKRNEEIREKYYNRLKGEKDPQEKQEKPEKSKAEKVKNKSGEPAGKTKKK